MANLSKRKFIKRGIFSIIGLVLLDAFWFEKYVIDWNYFDIAKNKNNKLKIVQLSDLHFDTIRYFHKSIAKKINQLQPDLILITGDAVDKTAKIEAFGKFLALMDNNSPCKIEL